jgi:hypothetical protein
MKLVRAALFIVVVVALNSTQSVHAASDVAILPPNAVVRGPVVEVTPLNGAPYTCYMLEMTDGVVRFQMLGGEAREAKTSSIRSIKFLTIAPPEVKRPFSPADYERLRQLNAKERKLNNLSAAEQEELRRLRERMPKFMRMGRMKFVYDLEDTIKAEADKGRLEAYISQQQKKIKSADSDDAARENLLMLALSYRYKGMSNLNTIEQLERDVNSIDSEKVRDAVKERLPEVIDLVRFKSDGGPKK